MKAIIQASDRSSIFEGYKIDFRDRSDNVPTLDHLCLGQQGTLR